MSFGDGWCTEKGESHIQAIGMEFLRGIKRITLHDQIYNRNEMGVKYILCVR